MASMYQEWVKQRYVAFGAAAGEVVYVGDPIDVGDWEEVQVQVDVMSSNAANDTDVTWNVQTCIAADNYPKWDSCISDQSLSKTAGTSAVQRITTSSTTPLRRWLRFILTHAVATASQNVTVHVMVLYKKRTP
jgi:hypothetical protein